MLHPHYDHHDFSEEIQELVEDHGVSPETAFAILKDWLLLEQKNNPERYAHNVALDTANCPHCQR